MRRAAFVILCGLLLASCATSYQRQGFTGGFDETQLGPNLYRVSFKGNGFTSADRASDLALLRCAELTLQSGFRYFAVVDSRAGTTQSAFTTPTQSYTTGTATASTYGSTTNISGQARTTTYGGDTIIITKPSATNTIVMFKSQSEFAGMTYDADFIYRSLGTKYDANRK